LAVNKIVILVDFIPNLFTVPKFAAESAKREIARRCVSNHKSSSTHEFKY
jgi:hypothetical protein